MFTFQSCLESKNDLQYIMECQKTDTVNLTVCDNCNRTAEMDQSTFSNSVIVLVAKLVIAVALKFWRACTAGLLILLLCYWLYGSFVAFSLLIVAILGEYDDMCCESLF